MKKRNYVMAGAFIALAVITGCKSKTAPVNSEPVSEVISQDSVSTESKSLLSDGLYYANFDTDSTMFHVNEAHDGKGLLTVKDGQMTIHVSLPSKNTLNLFYGLSEDAKKEGADLLQPTTDTVTYDDGMTEEVYGFDIPVPYLDDEFDVALIGKKGNWYDHKVKVSNPVPADDVEKKTESASEVVSDFSWDSTINVILEGGSGKAGITSPAKVRTTEDCFVLIVEWSSPNYDYMIVNDEKLLPVNSDGNSVFEIQLCSFDEPLDVIADTVAMSKPHEIEYTIKFEPDSLMPANIN